MFLQKISKFLYLVKIFLIFLIDYKSYLEFIKLIKFVFYQNKKIQYYRVRERYGQFVLGLYMALSTFKNDPVIFFLKKDIIYQGFDEEFKKIFVKKNCFFIQSEFIYHIVRFYFKNPKSENFIINYHPTETLKNREMFNFNIEKYLEYKNNNKVHKYLENKYFKKNNVKKIIIIALKEKAYYSSYNKVFKNYTQPDYEFDDFERLHKVAKYLCDKNYLVIRSGRYLKKSTFKHKLFFDYASSKKFNNFKNDLYIASITDYLIGNMTGFDPVCYLWFKKKVFNFQIRSYKFMLHFPNIFFIMMNIRKKNVLLDINTQMKLESSLWNTHQDQNDLYKILINNGLVVSNYSSDEIIKSLDFFLNNNLKKINNSSFYEKFLKYYSKEYKKIGKYLPVYKANLINFNKY